MSAKTELNKQLLRSTNILDREIKRHIAAVGAVDTGKMFRETKIVKLNFDENKMEVDFKIETTYYYQFVDFGTKNIRPREITQRFLDSKLTKNEFENIAEYVCLYMIDRQFE